MRALIFVILGALLAHAAQRRADTGFEPDISEELLFMPSGPMLKVAALGHHLLIADLLWIRTVLVFGERWGDEADPGWLLWFSGMISAINDLDPRWRTPYFYGGSLLRILDQVDASDQVFEAAMEHFPEDHFFPFAIGMNHYLYRDDAEAAREWLDRAAALPQAPKWYSAAARGFQAERLQRPTAIKFLQEEIATTEDAQLRKILERRVAGLQHDEYSEKLTSWLQKFEEEQGHPPSRPEELVDAGYLQGLPPEPTGSEWVVDPEGEIISATESEDRHRRSQRFELRMLRTAGTL